MPMSNVQPIQVELVKVDNGKVLFRLRKDIQNLSTTNDFTGQINSLYKYNELELILDYTNSIEKEVKESFDNFWKVAEEENTEKQALLEKQDQIKNLLDNNIYGQVSINQDGKQQFNLMNDMVNGFIDWYFSTHSTES